MFRKLRGRIVEYYGSIQAFAAALGISREMASRYLNGKAKFSADVMDRWGSLLNIGRSEYPDYFFA